MITNSGMQIGMAALLIVLLVVCIILLMALLQSKKLQKQEMMKAEEYEKRLKEAIKTAESARSSKSRFLAQTSHEIRTPLNIIMGMIELAKDEIDNREKMKDYLMKIEASSKTLLGIINDILDMSAIENGKVQIQQKKFDFKSQITNLALMFYQKAQKKNVHFDVQLKGVTEDILIGDEVKTSQILMKLVDNAVKFTQPGGEVMLTVIQASTSRERVHMRFQIKDTGCGMSKEAIDRIFMPFEQVYTDAGMNPEGSGLGLSITKNLVTMMGGFIQVNSKQSEGSEFIVDIPFFRTEQANREKVINTFATFKTLVVANDIEICKERAVVLEDMGLSYDTATDGETALDMIGSAEEMGDPYKLCVIDWKLSSMSGCELIQNIRNIFGNDMLIIGATYDISEAITEGKHSGADYMVGKPVFRSTMFDALMKLENGKFEKYEYDFAGKNYSFPGKKVLLAEDVAMNMEVVVKLLKKTGIEVICAENGKEAYEIFASQKAGFFDCIFLDINMPVMDGYEAARMIRESNKEDSKTVPIYAMTANAFTDDVAKALDVGMDGHIAKPIETDVLYSTLDNLFHKEQKE